MRLYGPAANALARSASSSHRSTAPRPPPQASRYPQTARGPAPPNHRSSFSRVSQRSRRHRKCSPGPAEAEPIRLIRQHLIVTLVRSHHGRNDTTKNRSPERGGLESRSCPLSEEVQRKGWELLEWLHKPRQEESKAKLKEIKKWMERQPVLPKSSMGKAISYLRGMCTRLTSFVDHPEPGLASIYSSR